MLANRLVACANTFSMFTFFNEAKPIKMESGAVVGIFAVIDSGPFTRVYEKKKVCRYNWHSAGFLAVFTF